MKRHYKQAIAVLVFAIATSTHAAAITGPIRGLIDRIAPGHAKDFVVETSSAPPGKNVFQVGARDGKIGLGGDNTLSQAAAFKVAAGQFMALGNDLDTVPGTRTEFLPGRRIADAKTGGTDKGERAYYERDARGIITVWGGDLTDYAGREWNGLMRDYYLPRWQLLINAALVELNDGKPVDRLALHKEWREHDLKFAATAGGRYAANPQGDFFIMSRELFDKYAAGSVKQSDALRR